MVVVLWFAVGADAGLDGQKEVGLRQGVIAVQLDGKVRLLVAVGVELNDGVVAVGDGAELAGLTVKAYIEADIVDDAAELGVDLDEIDHVGIVNAQEIEDTCGLAAFGAEMKVRQKQRPEMPSTVRCHAANPSSPFMGGPCLICMTCP